MRLPWVWPEIIRSQPVMIPVATLDPRAAFWPKEFLGVLQALNPDSTSDDPGMIEPFGATTTPDGELLITIMDFSVPRDTPNHAEYLQHVTTALTAQGFEVQTA